MEVCSTYTMSGRNVLHTLGYDAFGLPAELNAIQTGEHPRANTLANIRDAINSASDNAGVRAALLNTTAGVRLTLTSSQSGEDGAITVSSSGGDGGLSALHYQPGVDEQLQEIDPAQNARYDPGPPFGLMNGSTSPPHDLPPGNCA